MQLATPTQIRIPQRSISNKMRKRGERDAKTSSKICGSEFARAVLIVLCMFFGSFIMSGPRLLNVHAFSSLRRGDIVLRYSQKQSLSYVRSHVRPRHSRMFPNTPSLWAPRRSCDGYTFSSESLLCRMMAKRSASSSSITAIRTSEDTTRPFHLVIVESPSKCKTISSILRDYVKENGLDYDFVVTSCMGHVRNLPKSRKGSASTKDQPVVGVDIENQYTPQYEILPEKKGLVEELQRLARAAQQVVLATDEDREGEAVAWHLTQVLETELPFQRATFTEITPTAIREAIRNPHSLNMNLVEAQETRRVLDRLAGFTLSPVLWKKIAPGLSAGRVQSVGMALIVQRERERLLFRPAEYYDALATFDLQDGGTIEATLVAVGGVQIAGGTDFDNQGNLMASKQAKRHLTDTDVDDLVFAMARDETRPAVLDPSRSTWTVLSIQTKQRSTTPPMPFTTSTLQQESNRRLGLSVSQTMQCAQSLYESGFISYMRTDSTHLSEDAHAATERVVRSSYSSSLVALPRKTKSKNAQEAHEGIRPAIQPDGQFLQPDQVTGQISNNAAIQLYELIYKRTVASRMTSQILNQTSVEIEGLSPDEKTRLLFRLSGSVVLDPGYTLALGRSSSDTVLPAFEEGQRLLCNNLTSVDHATKPPSRYTEASFVKELEALGVGRPSTYAGTVKILRDRAYVGTPVRTDDSKRRRNGKQATGAAISAQRAAGGEEFMGGGRGPLVPSLTAFVVCSLLENHCGTYVDPGFTATMEERLDQIARGENKGDESMRARYLEEFYAGDDGLASKVKLIDQNVPADDARRAVLPSLLLNNMTHEIGVFVGPWGPYVQNITSPAGDEKPPSAPLPAGMASDLSKITPETLDAILSSRQENGVLMGQHPDDSRSIRLKLGRFGAYLQWGEDEDEGKTTHSLPKHISSMCNIDYESAVDSGTSGTSLGDMLGLTFDEAVGYVGLPRTVGTLHDLPILASIGPYGPYLKYNNSFVSLNKRDGDVLTVDDETAERLVVDGIINKSSKLGRGVLAELGEKDESTVLVKEGRFGTYLNWKRVNARLPLEYADDPESIPLDEAWMILQAKTEAGSRGSSSKRGTGISAAREPPSSVELPPAPKRPLSAYLHFCAEKRPEVSQKITSLGNVSKELARQWAETTDRSRFEALASDGKEAYQQAKREWRDQCQAILDKNSMSRMNSNNQISSSTKAASSKKPLPKRPLSAYLYFCSKHRAQVAETTSSLGNINKELARRWADTTDRSPYEAQAAADKLRYQQEMEQMNGGRVATSATNDERDDLKRKKNGMSNKKDSGTKTPSSKRRSPSAYMIFCREHRKTIVNESTGEALPFGETTQKLAELWRNCDEETRVTFQQLAQEEKERMTMNTE